MTQGFYERSLSDIVDRLTAAGYTDTFRGEAGGIRALKAGHLHKPEELLVESIDRFEGVTDPEEQAIARTIACSSGSVTPSDRKSVV